MKEENIPAINIFKEYLAKHKHRKTPERFAILEKIYAFEGHFDAETLFESMQNEYRVSLATVYNTLDLLLESGLVIKHQFDGLSAQYEKALGSNIHNHSVCIVCGKVKEFTDKKIRKAIQSKEFANFQSTHYSLYIYGVGKKCSKK
ncbi:MAG: Fur family transcriptional regulator [Paludibacter sp.]|nr:Fur family transcriptional regulator [Paludibacter sp.]